MKKIYHNLPQGTTKTVTACPKPSFNDWAQYIHDEVTEFQRNEIFDPVAKQNQYDEEERQREYSE